MKRSRPRNKQSDDKSSEVKKAKKRHKHSDADRLQVSEVDPRPSGRSYTISLALPGSIIDNAQSAELRTCLAGQIARAAAIFNIDEIVVFNEQGPSPRQSSRAGSAGGGDANTFLARILQYMETPQYLRKALFPMHSDLKLVGLLNPLDCPHHMRQSEDSDYREGVVLDRPLKQKSKSGSYVDCGLSKNTKGNPLPAPSQAHPHNHSRDRATEMASLENLACKLDHLLLTQVLILMSGYEWHTRHHVPKSVRIDKRLRPGVRVTVQLDKPSLSSKHLAGCVVSPSVPRERDGIYWGYTVRPANSLAEVFTATAFKGGYDLVMGTSERGQSIDELHSLPKFNHALVLFGGVQGLEYSLECDENLKADDVADLCDLYLNLCPRQGSRTIRTEEAILIGLSSLRPLLLQAGTLTSPT